MVSLSLLLSVAVLWGFAVVSPGPNFLVAARLSITRSRREGLWAVAGIGVGTVIWSAAGCFGIQILFMAAPWMYVTLKMLGGAYLVCLGGRLLWQSWRQDRATGPADSPIGMKAPAFHLGLLTTVANPRSAISVASIFASTMPSHPPVWLSLAVMAIMIGIAVGWYFLVVCVFTTRWLSTAYQQARRWIDRATGACFILFGAKLMAER
jgi:threonine/homoserine/homoserine lactone efflux protein